MTDNQNFYRILVRLRLRRFLALESGLRPALAAAAATACGARALGELALGELARAELARAELALAELALAELALAELALAVLALGWFVMRKFIRCLLAMTRYVRRLRFDNEISEGGGGRVLRGSSLRMAASSLLVVFRSPFRRLAASPFWQ